MEHTKRPSILVVDDTPENVQLLIMWLKEHGFRIAVAQSGEEALQRVAYALPDLILLDVMMPGMDGFETCRRLKAQEATRDIPVIFMTALSDMVDKIKGFEVGGVDYLTKPVQYEEVFARINTHLTIHELQLRLQRQNALLQEQNERFQRLSEATFEGIVIYDEGRIMDMNRTTGKMFAYQRTEILGTDFLELVNPESRETVLEHLRTKDERPYEAEGIKKDGSHFPVEMQVKTMPYDGRDVSIISIRDLSWRQAMEEEKQSLLRVNMQDRYKFEGIIGKSPVMQEVYHLIVNAATSEVNVVICGESGTGKELVARTIHQRSLRHVGPFVAVNCGAVPEPLFEREFFGHRKGAFTGADQDRPGFFDQAHNGTLFLDEVGELHPSCQVKLLRALEEKAFMPIGHTIRKHVNVRIIAATNSNLPELLRKGEIRKDFFYRIRVIEINLPPLRDRREDIPLLADHLLKQYSKGEVDCSMIPGHSIEALCTYDWPGNVRELQNELQRYLSNQPLEFIGDVHAAAEADRAIASSAFEAADWKLREALEAFEKRVIAATLAQNHWKTKATADILGITQRSLQRKIKKYQII